jgi:hypothetical protein
MDIKGNGYDDADWINLGYNKARWLAVVNTITTLFLFLFLFFASCCILTLRYWGCRHSKVNQILIK